MEGSKNNIESRGILFLKPMIDQEKEMWKRVKEIDRERELWYDTTQMIQWRSEECLYLCWLSVCCCYCNVLQDHLPHVWLK